MFHRRFKSELESGLIGGAILGLQAAKHLAAPVRQEGPVPLSLSLFWAFKASETTSRSRIEDAVQEVYMEDSFTGLTCRRVLCRRRNTQMLVSPYTLAHSRNHTAWHCDTTQQGPI
jgi:hypothetical protein